MASGNTAPPPYADNQPPQQPWNPEMNPYNAGYNQPQGGPKPYPGVYEPPPFNPYNAGYDQRPFSPPITNMTNVVVTQQPTVMAIVQPPRPTDWTVPAILVCLFCFWPTGIFAIITAVVAQQHANSGNMEDAKKVNTAAKWLTIISIILPIILAIILIVWFVTSEKSSYENSNY